MNDFGLDQRTMDALRHLFASYPALTAVYIYGSRATGHYRRASDIDLAIKTDGGPEVASHLAADLDELPTPYLFDVTDYDRLTHARLKSHIDQVGKLIYRRDDVEKAGAK